MNPTGSPTQALARWVVDSQWQEIDDGARAAARRSWLNWFGCALGGASDPALDRLVLALRGMGCSGTSAVIGRRERTDPASAALLHAFASNILDYDDTHWATAIHPAGPVASALVAWSSLQPLNAQTLLHAFLLGMEAQCRIGLAVSPGHYEKGWHITATCGVFGAALAVSRAMQLDAQQTAWAIGHAATQSSGLVASLGTQAKSLNIACAARNGLVAAQLARHGITANDRALEARFGFGDVMGPQPLTQALCADLGSDWQAARNTPKPYPCGFLLHPALDACLASDAAAGGTALPHAREIDRITLRVSPLAAARADRQDPADGIAAKLSLQHAVAVALLHGDAGVSRFTDQAAADPQAGALRAKVRVVSDPSLPQEHVRLQVHLRDGSQVIRRQPEAGPCGSAPMSDAALERKFRELVAFGSPHCDADRLLRALTGFAEGEDANALIAMTLPGP
ncbi:MAG: hypothetical protein RIS88_98 [Pseudomonadota bacterium]|jgi:2-methylcitrate dehydratase PrpD